jgi:PAS domain-containing protein
MLGYREDEMTGQPFFSLLDSRYQKISKVWLLQRRHGIREKTEFEMIRKDGSRIFTISCNCPGSSLI